MKYNRKRGMDTMRRVQKILGGIFLTGVLIGGVGTGIAVVEYSSLAYGGEKLIGEESLVTKTLDFDFEPDGRTLKVAEGRFWERDRAQEIEIDNTVPVGTVRFVVTYNEKTVTPSLEFEACEEEDMEAGNVTVWQEELQDMEDGYGEVPEYETEPMVVDGQEGTQEYTDSLQVMEESDIIEESRPQAKKEERGKMGTVRLTASYHERGFATLMENKDYMLAELKQGKISSYDVAYITDIKIKVNQKTAPYIESHYVIHE